MALKFIDLNSPPVVLVEWKVMKKENGTQRDLKTQKKKKHWSLV